MIKYIDEIDKRKKYYLPLIDFNNNGKYICGAKLPLLYYIKHQDILNKSKKYISLFNNIDIDSYFDRNCFQSYDSYVEAGENYSEYLKIQEEIPWLMEDINCIDIDICREESILSMCIKIISLLSEIYCHNKDIYEKDLEKFRKAYDEIRIYNNVVYDNNFKYKKVYLPDSWFILPNNYLYNTGGGHKVTNLIYDFWDVIRDDLKFLKKTDVIFMENIERIQKDGFTPTDFKTYENLIYKPLFLDKSHEIPTSHEPNTLKHIISVIYAEKYFYQFFRDIFEYTNDYKESIAIIRKLTSDFLPDIFVRCCGFHKIESTLEKTITTSCINYEEQFSEYIKRGWKISFIPPIIINKEMGIVEEYPEDFLTIRKVLKKDK